MNTRLFVLGTNCTRRYFFVAGGMNARLGHAIGTAGVRTSAAILANSACMIEPSTVAAMLIPSRPMADDKPLNDIETWDRLNAALDALGTAPGHTQVANTALIAARRSLVLLQMGVLKSAEADQVPFKGPAET